MLARGHVAPRLLLPWKPRVLVHASRFASKSAPKKPIRPPSDTVRPGRYQTPGRSATLRPQITPQDAPPSRATGGPFSFPSKLAAGVLGGIAVFAGFYTFSVFKSLSIESSQSRELEVDPDVPSVKIYDHIAPYFDAQVNSNEFWLGISRLRKQVVGQASGDVLEIGVGTGRNHDYYKLKGCRSITFLDASENMVAIASAKWNQRKALPEWKETAPDGVRRVNFRISSAEDGVVPPALAGEDDGRGFTTIVSTFTLCSMPRPALALAHLCELLARDQPAQSRVLLLEHGKSEYDWINTLLNNSAPAHAHQYGCWWNRDIGAIAAEAAQQAGMEITSLKRKHFGTTWIIEMKPKAQSSASKIRAVDSMPAASHAESVRSDPTSERPSSKKWWEIW